MVLEDCDDSKILIHLALLVPFFNFFKKNIKKVKKNKKISLLLYEVINY